MVKIYKENNLYYLSDDNPSLQSHQRKPRKDLQGKLERTKTALKWGSEMFYNKKDDPHMKQMFKHLINPIFGEPIFKFSCYLHTGYFTSGAKEDLYNKDHVTEEHWIPRTTVGKIIANAIVYNTDDFDALNGDCSLENIYRWIDSNTHLFCSIIISSKEENEKLNDLTNKDQYSFQQLLNLEHYKDLGISLSRNLSKFERYLNPKSRAKKWQHLWDNPHLNTPKWKHLKDDSFFYPNTITPAMQELCLNKGLTNVY